jgi:ankyrin repeat protein
MPYSSKDALHYAAYQGDYHKFKAALHTSHAHIISRDERGNTPFHHAASMGHTKIIESLLEEAKVCKKDLTKLTNAQGNTGLNCAILNGRVNIVNILLNEKWLEQHGNASLEIKNHYQDTPLNSAFINVKTSIITLLLKCGARVDTTNIMGDSPLHKAVKTGQYRLVKYLLSYFPENSPKLNIINKDGYAALHYAVIRGYIEIVKLLIQMKVNINIVDSHGETPLHLAVQHDDYEIAKQLLQAGAIVNLVNHSGCTAMYYSIANNSMSLFLLLHNHNAHLLEGDINKQNLLHYIASKGYIEFFQHLWDTHPNINIYDEQGNTPLQHAVIYKQFECVKFLLSHQAKINTKNIEGKTPLHYGVLNEDASMVQYLLENKADVEVKDNSGNFPLHYAAIRNNKEIMQWLLKYKAYPDSTNSQGDTPLHCTTWYGHLLTTECLLAYGANPYIKNIEGYTPFQNAKRDNKQELCAVLQSNIMFQPLVHTPMTAGLDPATDFDEESIASEIMSPDYNRRLSL